MSNNNHMDTDQSRRAPILVRWTSHAMVVAVDTARNDTNVETQRELKIPRPV